MDINLTKKEVSTILDCLSKTVAGLRYDLDGGWIEDEDECEEAEATIVEANALWDKLYLIYRKAIKE